MLYSVITSTDDSAATGKYPVDLAEHEESWLVKLGSWADALQVYERRLFENPRDFDAVLGCMKCLDATGEWKQVLDIAEKSWVALIGDKTVQETTTAAEPRTQAKALKLCAQAAWRLKQWEDLEKFASQLVGANSPTIATATTTTKSASLANSIIPRVDFDGAFFSAVLHIHRKEWALAARAIDVSRKAMDSRFTALMAESYSRAYPSMVTAQNLAEMEEIIEYRKLEDRAKAGADNHPANRPNEMEARQRLLSIWRERLAGCRVDADVHSSILVVRSLVLNPLDEVEATLCLSDLSRQAQRFKLAERVLLDPLMELRADLNGPVFGFGLPESLGLGAKPHLGSGNSASVISRLVTGDGSHFRPNYGSLHEQISKQLLQSAGGLERYVQGKQS
jgi:FKBP12-rapamycin complex-associated protein